MPPKTTKPKDDLKLLKNSVYIMGVLLVVGTIALMIAVVVKASSGKPPESKVVYNTVQAQKPDQCKYKATDIPVQSKVLSATTNGSLLTIITEKAVLPKNVNKVVTDNSLELTADKDRLVQQVILYNLCEGEVVSRIDLVESR